MRCNRMAVVTRREEQMGYITHKRIGQSSSSADQSTRIPGHTFKIEDLRGWLGSSP
jgi:hypothetical protein